MPCDSVRTISVDLSSLGRIDLDLLAQALTDLGQNARVYGEGERRRVTFDDGSFVNGTLTINGYSDLKADAIKQAYSSRVVMKTASRFGWMLKETTAGQKGQVQR